MNTGLDIVLEKFNSVSFPSLTKGLTMKTHLQAGIKSPIRMSIHDKRCNYRIQKENVTY